MKSGPRDTLIVVQSLDEVKDGIGYKQNWTTHLSAWASVNYGQGSERRQAAQEAASIVATFQIPSSIKARQITPKHRLYIKSDGDKAVWDIVSAVPSKGQINEGIDITAKRNVDHG